MATENDVEAIAQLHAQSWRDHYRGVYADVFLDHEAEPDRLEVWSRRLAGADTADAFTVVAESDSALVGFAYVILGDEATLQNLHVRTDAQRKGVGSRLVAEVLRTVGPLQVWVREDNATARAFYESRGGRPVGWELGGPFADGSRAMVLRYTWGGDH